VCLNVVKSLQGRVLLSGIAEGGRMGVTYNKVDIIDYSVSSYCGGGKDGREGKEKKKRKIKRGKEQREDKKRIKKILNLKFEKHMEKGRAKKTEIKTE
jgi:hypothetical protein